MSRPIAVLRPEPGNAATAARIEAAGSQAIRMPLFTIVPLRWTPPDARAFDGLLLTSANAIRHGGERLEALKSLPVLAVGAATADAARAAGFRVVHRGDSDRASLLARAQSWDRLLWLSARERDGTGHHRIRSTIPVYAAEAHRIPMAAAQALAGAVSIVHSSRAAIHLGSELDRHQVFRASAWIAAISPKVAEAAGGGWGRIGIASTVCDTALIAVAQRLAIDP